MAPDKPTLEKWAREIRFELVGDTLHHKDEFILCYLRAVAEEARRKAADFIMSGECVDWELDDIADHIQHELASDG